MSFTMKSGQIATVEAFKTLEQNVLALDASWTCDWETSDADVVSVTADNLNLRTNPTARIVLNAGDPGTATITVTGNGVSATLDVTVTTNDQFGLTIVPYQAS